MKKVLIGILIMSLFWSSFVGLTAEAETAQIVVSDAAEGELGQEELTNQERQTGQEGQMIQEEKSGKGDQILQSGIFGATYSEIKEFNTSSLPETAIGDTGYRVSTTSSNYNNVVIMDNATKSQTGYYPYGSGLSENGYYLFFGSGGNSSVRASIMFDQAISAGKYIKITYAKPYATNNGTSNRNQDNSADNKITVGNEVIDLKTNCDFDKWYTSIVKVNAEITKLDINLGKWGAIAISDIEIADNADTMEFVVENNIVSKYITSQDQTVQYIANVYNSITTHMGDTEFVTKGSVDEDAKIAYSVDEHTGVSINTNGTMTITPYAEEGTVTVRAECQGITKELSLELIVANDADGVKIVGDELIEKGSTLSLKALPIIDGEVIPERATEWSIEGDNHGAAIENGILTVPEFAQSGNITIMATLKQEGAQVSENIADTFIVTIKGETASPYTIKGIFLKNCVDSLDTAEGMDGIAIEADSVLTGCKAVVKAIDANGMVIAQTQVVLEQLPEGVSEVKIPLTFQNAAQVKAYIVNEKDEIISEEIYKTTETIYKNVPLVSDWITGEKSGLGMGKGIMAPQGAPVGIDPDTVNVSDLHISYVYNEDYPIPATDNALWYKTGAFLQGNSNGNNSIYARDGVDWEQKALPIGNGYMGGMLFGLPDKDQIQFNEETFWAAGYRGVQTSVNMNNVNKNMSEGINGFMSVGNIFIDFHMPEGAQVKNYYRDLNLDEAIAHVRYEYEGIEYNREYFASYPKEVLVFRYTADMDNALNFDVAPVSMHPGEVTVNEGEITIVGRLKDSEPYSSGGNAAWNQKSDLEYCTKIKVIADDGTITNGYNSVNVKNATGVTIIVTAATDYDPEQFEIRADGTVNMDKTPYKSTMGVQAAIDKAEARMDSAAVVSYDDLKAEHIADYKSQFDKVKFSLTEDDEICRIPTDELQKSYDSVISTKTNNDGTTSVSYDARAYNNLNKHLEELHYNYARYMMISASRSNTMPATLQGKWCQSTAEIWGSCYCININMEMNYWFAGGANLLDSGESLVGWFRSQIPAGRITAKNMYEVTPKSYRLENGGIKFTDSTAEEDDVFIMHTKQAIMGTTDLTGSTSIQSAGNTAWLIYNLWDLYLTSGDKELLANDLYPIMRKAANFYTQYLYTNGKKFSSDMEKYPDGYYYTTWEGRSPEQGPTHEGIKYDLQLVAGMYDYAIRAAEILGVDAQKVTAWKEIRNHLEIPVELGMDGQIKEWAEETSYNTDTDGNALGDPTHRHISHLVGLYPGTLINRDTPELLNGAKIVLQRRGDDSTGWSCSNKFLLWARTLEGDKALELFRYQLAKKTYSNLFDTHAPFQIDGNFGSAAGVMELLMQSQTGDIYILPALPSVWDKGEISGIKAKNGAEISIKWENNKATEIKIVPSVDGDITVGYDMGNIISLDGTAIFFTDGKYTIENAKKGKIYRFSIEKGTEPTEPTTEPTANPTIQPTTEPTTNPTLEPTAEPTLEPTTEPTLEPTAEPTLEPTAEPTLEPTTEPTLEPTTEPTLEPTAEPTLEPTTEPTSEPTTEPIGEVKPGAVNPDTCIVTGSDELKKIFADDSNQILTAEERKEFYEGAECELSLNITDITNTVPAEIRSRMVEVSEGFTIRQFLDVSLRMKMVKKSGEVLSERQLTDIGNSELEIEIKLSESLSNTNESFNREYVIIREHKGEYDLLPAIFDKGLGTLRFMTGRYSNYAIAYKDVKLPEPTAEPNIDDDSNHIEEMDNNMSETANQPERSDAPKTGDYMDNIAMVWMIIMVMSGIVVVLVVKRHGKSE